MEEFDFVVSDNWLIMQIKGQHLGWIYFRWAVVRVDSVLKSICNKHEMDNWNFKAESFNLLTLGIARRLFKDFIELRIFSFFFEEDSNVNERFCVRMFQSLEFFYLFD